MNAYRVALRVPENHILHVTVPEFEAGTDVEVIVLPRHLHPVHGSGDTQEKASNLYGLVLRYESPFEPVATTDWEALA